MQGKHGRNQTYSDTAIQYYLIIKSLFKLPLRMVTRFVQNLIPILRLAIEKSSDHHHLLMDSSGFKFLGEGEWKWKKHQPVANCVNYI